MQPFEKVGAFYLGRGYDPERQAVRDDLLLYESKDLTTHAVCVGMTGSGKTGLCLSLLEEAAIDGIPAIAIDPKGDLGNLLLSFPGLRPEEFRPWIDEAEATRKGQTPDEYAASVAALWKKGLGEWGQDGDRIRRFREAVDLAIYTPGSTAGLPLKVLRSFTAPPPELRSDPEALRDRTQATVSGLLALLEVNADPLRSREHILLSNLLHGAWSRGEGRDLAGLIREIQQPPFDRVGVMDLESFYPAKDRFDLATSLNNLLASPGFATWMEGEPLQIPRLLWTEAGKPRLSILSIAHLSEPERMFFVTLLLNEVLAWVRTQPGTSSLRAILYMDEIFGFFPPTANPPSKRPMLTLLKQARAYGLGVVLATQNPVDLDYKGLSNTGTWFLGRLQTERDKARVLDGLEGASAATGAAFDRKRIETILSGMRSRVFLMNNVHDDEPALFHTRWALSFLRGPLTRAQIGKLMAERKGAAAATAAAPAAGGAVQAGTERPVLPPDVPEHFLPRPGALASGRLVYRPALLGVSKLHFVSARDNVDHWTDIAVLAPLRSKCPPDPWKGAAALEDGPPELRADPDSGGEFSPLPPEASAAKSYSRWSKSLAAQLYREQRLGLWKCKTLKATSRPGESERDFQARLQQLAREARDLKLEKLRKRYAPKLARLQDRIRRAEDKVEKESAQYGQQKLHTAISVGATVLGALFGRKIASVGSVGRATTAVRGASRAARERGDIARAQDEMAAQQQKLETLEQEFEEALDEARDATDLDAMEVEEKPVRPRKSDIAVERVALVWTPWRVSADGVGEPEFP